MTSRCLPSFSGPMSLQREKQQFQISLCPQGYRKPITCEASSYSGWWILREISFMIPYKKIYCYINSVLKKIVQRWVFMGQYLSGLWKIEGKIYYFSLLFSVGSSSKKKQNRKNQTFTHPVHNHDMQFRSPKLQKKKMLMTKQCLPTCYLQHLAGCLVYVGIQ